MKINYKTDLASPTFIAINLTRASSKIQLHTCGGRGGSGRGTAEEREEAGVGWLLVVEEQILRHPERTVCAHNCESDQQSRDEERAYAGDEHNDHRQHDEADQGFRVGESAAADDKRLLGRPEEVEERPRAEEGEEDEEREGVREEREGEHNSEQGDVVDAEIGEILADPGVGLGEGVGSGHGAPVQELVPGAALGEAIADRGGEA